MIFEVGLPRRTFEDKSEALKFINNHNGRKKALFQSVYTFTEKNGYKPKYDTAIINKLFFDFDSKASDCWAECNKLHQHLLQKNIKHLILWSGRGYHLFVYVVPLQTEFTKSCIYNAQMSFINNLNLDCDMQVIGDHSRLRRIPNSYHPVAKRFCIYLSKEDFAKGLEYCKNKAKQQNFNINYVGETLLDISAYNYKSDKIDSITNVDEVFKDSTNHNYLNICDIKIKQLLGESELGWNNRYIVILYFREMGFTINEVSQILKNHLSEKKYNHCVNEEKQLQYLFSRDDLMFPESFGIKVYK